MVKKILCLHLCILLVTNFMHAQNLPPFPNQELSNFLIDHPTEELYVNTDRDVYAYCDTIWLKSYLLKSETWKPIAQNRNVYIELIDDENTVRIRKLVLSENGFAKANIVLAQYQLTEGRYQLRAYTNYQQNYGMEYLFSKNLLIRELHNKKYNYTYSDLKQNKKPQNSSEKSIDLQFLPEGGSLSYGLSNNLAFIAKDTYGNPIEIEGFIIDEDSRDSISFKTVHQGMGSVPFTPEPNHSYKVIVNNYLKTQAYIPQAVYSINMQVNCLNDSLVAIQLLQNEALDASNYFILGSSHGIISFQVPILINKAKTTLKLRKKEFIAGINLITLINEKMEPIAERMVFIEKSKPIELIVTTTKEQYEKKEIVRTRITGSDAYPMHLSVTVLNINQSPSIGKYPHNIYSYLLLDSELKGQLIESGYYFKDDSLLTKQKLDLVMLTQGWRNYKYNSFKSKLPLTQYIKESGLTLSGQLQNLSGNRSCSYGQVSMMIHNKGMGILTNKTLTDSHGYFTFNSSYFPDSVVLFLQGKNKRGSNYVSFNNIHSFTPPAQVIKGELNFELPSDQSQEEFKQMAYTRLMNDRALKPEKYVNLLDEVAINERKINNQMPDGSKRTYSHASSSISMNQNAYNYTCVWDYIASVTHGVYTTVQSGQKLPAIKSRGNKYITPAYCILDGKQVDISFIATIPIQQIEKVDILRSAASTSIYGKGGFDGVIAVYLKDYHEITAKNSSNGTLKEMIRGYHVAKEFYSPVYNSSNSMIPDHRATIYWNPELITNTIGEASFEFHTTDDAAPCLIKVEGISPDGKVGMGFAKFQMTGKKLSNKTD